MAFCEVLEVVKRYTGFEELVVKIAVKNERSLMETMPTSQVCRFLQDRDDTISMLEVILNLVLGVGLWGGEDGNCIITYHPQNM